jgi:catechol 2,3-dioxygenase-like lactoylglutathione lyase family enzyme
MKFHSLIIIVVSIDRSKEFYVNLLREEIWQDLKSYVVFRSCFSIVTREQ